MIARPPNISQLPIHRNGTRFQPRIERCVSDLKPSSARNGANSSGNATIADTSQADTPSSTIITRLSVPTSSTVQMPTATWNIDSRSKRPSGRPTDAASANGRNRGAMSRQRSARIGTMNFTAAPVPTPARCRSRR